MSAKTIVRIGISTKSYLSYTHSLSWLEEVTRAAASFSAVREGAIQLFLAPTFPILEAAVRITADSGIEIAAQDVSRYPAGAYTGEVPASFLSELGVKIVELGHAERRNLFGETNATVVSKSSLIQGAGMVPLLCVGEPERTSSAEAVRLCLSQIPQALTGPAILAYEPVWAIGGADPAPTAWICEVAGLLREEFKVRGAGIEIIYGGSAGPGLLSQIYPEVDGLFLGRSAHDVNNVRSVLEEATELLPNT